MEALVNGRKRWVVGITGASGAVYGLTLIKQLLLRNFEVHLVITDAGWRVLKEEMDFNSSKRIEALQNQFGAAMENKQLIYYPNADIGAAVASGSFRTEGMVIIPCSMGTLASVSHGLSHNLLARAADVVLKEGRPLIIVPRETPLHEIHLENMLRLAKMKVKIIPAMPAFYNGPQSLDDMVMFLTGKVLDGMEIEHQLYRRWGEKCDD